MKVTGLQVNGYIFSTTSATSSLSSSTPVPTSTLNSEQNSKDGHGTISTGAVIGVAIGAAIIGVLASLIAAWFVLRRYRRKALEGPQSEVRYGEDQPVFVKGFDPMRNEMATVERAQELHGNRTAHELHGSYSSRL